MSCTIKRFQDTKTKIFDNFTIDNITLLYILGLWGVPSHMPASPVFQGAPPGPCTCPISPSENQKRYNLPVMDLIGGISGKGGKNQGSKNSFQPYGEDRPAPNLVRAMGTEEASPLGALLAGPLQPGLQQGVLVIITVLWIKIWEKCF